jgi:hypothetical protein
MDRSPAGTTTQTTITLTVPCAHCGENAAMELDDVQARQHAAVVLAACDDVPVSAYEVVGGDQ